jgi:hypothetical protein
LRPGRRHELCRCDTEIAPECNQNDNLRTTRVHVAPFNCVSSYLATVW